MSKKINFLGLDVEVVCEQEMADAPPGSVYMMMRVDDVRDRASQPFMWPALLKRRLVVRCDDCQQRCWFDPEGGWLNLPEGTDRICMQCTMVRAEKAKNDQS